MRAVRALRAVRAVVAAGDALLCAWVWEPSNEVSRPLRAVLQDAGELFPAISWPYVSLLANLSKGHVAAAAAYANLQARALAPDTFSLITHPLASKTDGHSDSARAAP